MSEQQFKIQKKIVEVETNASANAHELQNRISQLVNFTLMGQMEKYFGEVIPEELLFKIDQMVLDIGNVSWNTLESDFEAAFLRLLEEEFSLRLQLLKDPNNSSQSGITVETVGKGKIQLLEFFLKHGVLPWYADGNRDFNMDRLVEELYQTNKAELRELLRHIGGSELVRRRISYQFEEESIKSVVAVLVPVEAEYIYSIHRNLTEVQKETQVASTQLKEFSRSVWRFVLDYLLVDMSSEFSKKMFVRSNLMQLSAHYNISYVEVLQVFYTAINTDSTSINDHALSSVLYELFTEDTEIKPAEFMESRGFKQSPVKFPAYPDQLEVLQYYLKTGSLPPDSGFGKRERLVEAFFELARAAPLSLRQMLLAVNTGETERERLFDLLGPAAVRDFIKLVFYDKVREVEAITGSLQVLHTIRPLIDVSTSEMNRRVWRVMLDTLFITDYSKLDNRRMVQSVLLGLGNRATSAAGLSIDKLRESLQDGNPAISSYAPAITVFRDVIEEWGASFGSREDQEAFKKLEKFWKEKPETLDFSGGHSASVFNVLRFVFKYGVIPWWGRSAFRESTSELMQRLFDEDPQAAKMILKESLVSPFMRTRLFHALSAGLSQKLMLVLPEGGTINRDLVHFRLLLERSALVRQYNTEYLHLELYKIAFEQYATTGYRLFSRYLFYTTAIEWLGKLLQKTTTELTQQLIAAKSLAKDPEEIQMIGILEETQLIFSLREEPVRQDENMVAGDTGEPGAGESADTLPDGDMGEHPLLDLIYPPGENKNQSRVSQLAEVLRYFLVWNRLPDTLIQDQAIDQPRFLREMLRYLFLQDRMLLATLLNDKANSVTAVFYVNELFNINEGGTEKRLSVFLLNQTKDTLPTPADKVQRQKLSEILEREKQRTDLRDYFAGFSEDSEMPDRETIEHRAKELLSHFLKHKGIPADIPGDGKWAEPGLLKSVIFFLFETDPEFVRKEFRADGVSAEAKLLVYNQLAMSADKRAMNLVGLLSSELENDIGFLLAPDSDILKSDRKEWLQELISNVLEDVEKVPGDKESSSYLLSPAVVKMIIEVHGFSLLSNITDRIPGSRFKPGAAPEGWVQLIEQSLPAGFAREKLREQVKHFILISVGTQLYIPSASSFSDAFLDYLFLQVPVAGELEQLLKRIGDASNIPIPGIGDHQDLIKNKLAEVIIHAQETDEVERLATKWEDQKKEEAFKMDIVSYRERIVEELKSEAAGDSRAEEKKGEDKFNQLVEEEREHIYIWNAGLVLFHPFLETYFGRTGLVESRQFKDVAARNRAVLLLQYLADGKTEHEEHELVLNKILCGMPVSETLPLDFKANEEELAVTEELFEVFKERWKKVKNTSVEGLRQSFILRSGMLSLVDGNWNLKVEQKGIDILVQTFPWSFGYIRTPWMQNTLIVEWI